MGLGEAVDGVEDFIEVREGDPPPSMPIKVSRRYQNCPPQAVESSGVNNFLSQPGFAAAIGHDPRQPANLISF